MSTTPKNKILIREVNGQVHCGPWRQWRPKPRFVREHTLEGLKGWMTKYRKEIGWNVEDLTQNLGDPNIYNIGFHQFSIPVKVAPTSNVIKFRRAVSGMGIGAWRDFVPTEAAGSLVKHSLGGLKEWMDRNRKRNWDPDKLCRATDDEHVFGHGHNYQFWIPVPPKEIIMWRNVSFGVIGEWTKFVPVAGTIEEHSVRGLKEWMDRGGVMKSKLLVQEVSDRHVFRYGNHTHFCVPDLTDGPRPQNLRVCVCALGCPSLTEGKPYTVAETGDNMLKVTDDEGTSREFLPERFAGK